MLHEVIVSDFHATERIIGGLIVAGVASLLSWSASQGGEQGVIGVVLIGAMVLGGLWTAAGIVELIAGPKWKHGRITIGSNPSEPTSPGTEQVLP